jgi:hypothetical protein
MAEPLATKSTVEHSANISLPPFSKERSIFHGSHIHQPATFRIDGWLLKPDDDFQRFLDMELRLPKLNKIHNHLWLAGLPKPARPLHRQRLMNRTICLTERPDEHMVWHESRIFIKPMPEYLLDYELWQNTLCAEIDLYQCACGLLLSYSWLIGHKSDFRIAKETGILPEEIEWPMWTAFVTAFLDRVNPNTLHQVNRRYQYGELRLSRLNSLYRLTPSLFSTRNFFFGFMSRSTWYRAFFERNFTWLLAVLVYVTVVLSAMQVALAIPRLQSNKQFLAVSYAVSVGSMVAFAILVACITLMWVLLFCYHLFSTRQYLKHVEMERTKYKNNPRYLGERPGQ